MYVKDPFHIIMNVTCTWSAAGESLSDITIVQKDMSSILSCWGALLTKTLNFVLNPGTKQKI